MSITQVEQPNSGTPDTQSQGHWRAANQGTRRWTQLRKAPAGASESADTVAGGISQLRRKQCFVMGHIGPSTRRWSQLGKAPAGASEPADTTDRGMFLLQTKQCSATWRIEAGVARDQPTSHNKSQTPRVHPTPAKNRWRADCVGFQPLKIQTTSWRGGTGKRTTHKRSIHGCRHPKTGQVFRTVRQNTCHTDLVEPALDNHKVLGLVNTGRQPKKNSNEAIQG